MDIPVGWKGDEPIVSPFTYNETDEGTCREADGWFQFQSPDNQAIISFDWAHWSGVTHRTTCFWKESVRAKDIVDISDEDEVIFSDYVTEGGETRRWQYLHHFLRESTGRSCDTERATLTSITRHYIVVLDWSACQRSVERYRSVLNHFLDSFSSRDSKHR